MEKKDAKEISEELLRPLNLNANQFLMMVSVQGNVQLTWMAMTALEADVNYSDPVSGKSILSATAKSGQVYTLQLLVGFGANIGHKNRDGSTAITEARESDHTDIANYLEEERKRQNLESNTETQPQTEKSQERHSLPISPPGGYELN